MFTCPASHYLHEFGASVFSIVKEGNKAQDYHFKLTNHSQLDASVRLSFPLEKDPKKSRMFTLSLLPARLTIRSKETKVTTIKVKTDYRQSFNSLGGSFSVDLEKMIEVGTREKKLPPKTKSTDQPPAPSDQHSLLLVQVVDTEVMVAVPIRVLFKEAKKNVSLLDI